MVPRRDDVTSWHWAAWPMKAEPLKPKPGKLPRKLLSTPRLSSGVERSCGPVVPGFDEAHEAAQVACTGHMLVMTTSRLRKAIAKRQCKGADGRDVVH